MPETILFYLLAGVAIVASALVIGQRNPMYSIMLLIASFGALSGLYIQLDAPFGALLAGLLIVQLAWSLIRASGIDAAVGERGDAAAISSVRAVGRVLFTDY